ncbi:hypothetical protein K503DRAFT_806022 [Rhizopogon vinicolor AM-OR11-026]|uniref:Uncharacterized protein n=1 Tax=Rhizopogon vinicolor AM-OR11-026 TaxID=1314800 RepID=A0A1B7MFY2_9AGAM|nr:hypothetical protein K503DRAFT_806022 [Rhizopogon vinicolor AM-OR11-026]
MYQQSRKMLIFLIVITLPIQTIAAVFIAIPQSTGKYTAEEYILSGNHICDAKFEGDAQFLTKIIWILGTAWEVLALSLAAWIAVKRFRELERSSTGWAVRDCFTVLMKTHIFYFASFVAVSCFELLVLSQDISGPNPLGSEVYKNVLEIANVVQMFVLGPRLILGLREYHAKLVANSDEGTGMTSVVFQERIQITTGGGV